jgi:hypothetical protein
MKRLFFKRSFAVFILMLIVFCAVSVNAQNRLNGTYVYRGKQGKEPYSLRLKFEREDAVYCSFEYKGAGTISGNWKLENGVINVVLTRGSGNWTFKFRRKDSDLKVAETFPKNDLEDITQLKELDIPAGIVFKKDTSKPPGPNLTAEDFSRRVLKMVKSIYSLKDLSPENIKRRMQIKLYFDKKEPNRYGGGGSVIGAENWFYGVDAYPYRSKDNKTTDTIRFSFDYDLHEPVHPDLAPVCAVEFDAFSAELKSAGFSAPEPVYGVHGIISYWNSSRGKTSVYISAGREKADGTRQCVEMLTVSILK